MCGIVGVVGMINRPLSVQESDLLRMRESMAARGPDGAGMVRKRNTIFAHRRLAVIDPSGGAQPMFSADGRFLLVYNGELYNDAEIRELLLSQGTRFSTGCDTETVLAALAAWGEAALPRLRGMFALALYDFANEKLLVARDPLGLKPIYFAGAGGEFVFASTLRSLMKHPGMSVQPDAAGISAYLTTLCTNTGNRTLLKGVRTLRPGELLTWNARVGGDPVIKTYWREPTGSQDNVPFDHASLEVRDLVADSVARHLRSDAPRALYLSGGLDSAIVACLARTLEPDAPLHTWCASDVGDAFGDAAHAQRLAEVLNAEHHEIAVGHGDFERLWPELVQESGMPLSTPNQIAIYMVARQMKTHGFSVALTGEGADEMFAGYGPPLQAGVDWVRAQESIDPWRRRILRQTYGVDCLGSEAEHYLRTNSWIAPSVMNVILQPAFAQAAEVDELLLKEVEWQFKVDGERIDPLERLLRVHRRINLTRLLERLDSCTMLAGIEGRTPFADVCVMEHAMRLPMPLKFSTDGIDSTDPGASGGTAVTLVQPSLRTKRVLREAFCDLIPPDILGRPKVSFSIPFRDWMGGGVRAMCQSKSVAEIFRPGVLQAVAHDPAGNWMSAWPILNVAYWCENWFE